MTINQIRIRVEERLIELDAKVLEYSNKCMRAKSGSVMEKKWNDREILARQERRALLETLTILNNACKTIKY